jgi:hypothetical protein
MRNSAVLEARLQLERRRNLAVQVAGAESMMAEAFDAVARIAFCSTARPLNRMSCHVPVPAF